MYRIKEVAKMAGISVRTLHYYDRIGLLRPEEVKENGYRYYSDEDCARLQQILFFKELGFSLKNIQATIDRPDFDRRKALMNHQKLLEEKKQRLEKILQSVEKTIESLDGGKQMSIEEMFEPFDMKKIEEHQKKYEQESKELYGHTDAYKESARRVKQYTEEDWRRIKEQNDEIYGGLIRLINHDPRDVEVQSLIGRYRQSITDYFYECTPEIFRGLGGLYISDERFRKNIDQYQHGLAAFMSKAIEVYCDQLESK
ncbi:MerR family transcriptional regulator [Radiobacillus deserti]|nr:MerR family transcriptional regulator [Radiobacillus deserti]